MDLSKIENLLNGIGELKKPETEKVSLTSLADEFLVKIDKYNIVANELKTLFTKFYKILENNGLIPRKGVIPKYIVKYNSHPTVNTTYYLHGLLFSIVKGTLICQCDIANNYTSLVISSVKGSPIVWYMSGPYKLTYKLGSNDLYEFVKFDSTEGKADSNYLELMNQAMDKLISEMERAIENFEEDSLNLTSSFVDKYYVKDKH